MIAFETEHLLLRTMTRAEYHQARQKYVPDPMMDPGPYAYDALLADEAYDRITAAEKTYPRVGIFRKEDGEIIGELSFKRIDWDSRRCDLGIALCQDADKESGYGGEAFGAALAYATGPMGLVRVFADTMGSNIRMQRILQRLGFRCFMRHEAAYDMKDRMEDRLDYIYDVAEHGT